MGEDFSTSGYLWKSDLLKKDCVKYHKLQLSHDLRISIIEVHVACKSTSDNLVVLH